jgi:hypothetical protein
MSRLYEAAQATKKFYPNPKGDEFEEAVQFFVSFMDMDKNDIEYEIGEPIEKYVYDKGEQS